MKSNRRFSKRQKGLLWTGGCTLLVMAVSSLWLWWPSEKQQYIPGERTEGLTARLDREIPPEAPRGGFKDVTEQAGIGFMHFEDRRSSQLAEDMGSGVAWIDYNNSGWDDLFLVNYSGSLDSGSDARMALYRNNADGTFTDVSEEAGLDIAEKGMATAWADVNNNGWIDCLITLYGGLRLFLNNGDGTFTDATQQAGLAGFDGYYAGAAWGDFNRSGYVDLYVTGYVDYRRLPSLDQMRDLHEPPSLNPSTFDPVRNLLLKNNGDGTFTEMAAEAGVDNPEGRSLEVAWIDFTGDMLPDLYVANDVSENMFYRNMGDGTFVNMSHRARIADYRGSMGMAIGDWDANGAVDLFITHWIAEENAFYRNLSVERELGSRVMFRDDADMVGLGQASLQKVGWATSFFDLDNSGRLDLFVVNGHTNQDRRQPESLIGQEDQIFWNRDDETGYYDISPIAGSYFSERYVGRGGAMADYNRNGRLDLFVLNHNGPGILLENRIQTDGNWLQVKLEGVRSNRSAIGARIRVVAGNETQIRQVGVQSSYLSQNSLVEHFGLGESDQIDLIEIRWPSGTVQEFRNIAVGQRLEIREDQAEL